MGLGGDGRNLLLLGGSLLGGLLGGSLGGGLLGGLGDLLGGSLGGGFLGSGGSGAGYSKEKFRLAQMFRKSKVWDLTVRQITPHTEP